MRRVAWVVEYEGSAFVGWQRQKNGVSVQGALEGALARHVGVPIAVTAAGRTDSGVHATGQVVHADVPARLPVGALGPGLNRWLPEGVKVRALRQVPGSFDARRSAVSRTYRYRILDTVAPSPLRLQRVWWVKHPLDDEAMMAAATCFQGMRDWSAVRAAGCAATHPVRDIHWTRPVRCGDEIEVEVRANAFLYHMVRNMVAGLVAVGQGKLSVAQMAALLEARRREDWPPTAPAQGLALERVGYPAARLGDLPEFRWGEDRLWAVDPDQEPRKEPS
ncbi:MAG: tRNA pseudouridine(38-40) synthase TruA [Proteobacteria bacterium CG1_02_64_396]|nr:MAG: tRNA pseudouridine(38-40) synthase TruA [Proteobacteria bacterium CG1_02_64_396]